MTYRKISGSSSENSWLMAASTSASATSPRYRARYVQRRRMSAVFPRHNPGHHAPRYLAVVLTQDGEGGDEAGQLPVRQQVRRAGRPAPCGLIDGECLVEQQPARG